jgi:hypothetical protein
MNIQYRDQDHTYTIDGKQVPSVTQVLDILGSIYNPIVDGLRKAMKIDDDEARNAEIHKVLGWVPKYLENYHRAAKLGTYVHKTIEWYEAGTLDLEALDPALAPYLTAWIAFRQENPLRIDIDALQWETIVGSRHGYAGRVDLMNPEWIIDIKSGVPTKTHPHQLEAYNRAAIETQGGKRRQTANLYLSDDGKYRIIIRNKKRDESTTTWNQFLAALTVHNFKNGGKAE